MGDPEIENIDLSKLDFEYDAFFVDSKTIKLDIRFVSPVYVSANPLEDKLVIKFQGPIVDQIDGQLLPDAETIIKRPLPPQLERGIITETIEASAETV